MAYNDTRNPLRALQRRLGAKILIRLKDGTQYVGVLKEFDNYMNLIINDCTEILNEKDPPTNYAELFIRGSNILFIKPNA